MTGSEKTAADFVAIVKHVLATVLEKIEPPPVSRPEDVASVVAELVERVMAVYPHPRRGPLIGYSAIIDHYGMDSSMAARARFRMGLHDFGLRYRGQRHRESAGLPAPLVEEPDLDAAAAELLELFRLRHRGVEARRGYAPAA